MLTLLGFSTEVTLEDTVNEARLKQQLRVIKDLLPLLRKRADPMDPDNARAWSLSELSERTMHRPVAIREALEALRNRTDADLFFERGVVKLLGPKRINLREAFKPGAPPSTRLAKAFRRHGVRLSDQLRPTTSWMQIARTGELVLTLDVGLMSRSGRQETYDAFKAPGTRWEAQHANMQRKRALHHLEKSGGTLFRAIRVHLNVDTGIEKITSVQEDLRYWCLTRLDDASGRFCAERTETNCRMFPLSETG